MGEAEKFKNAFFAFCAAFAVGYFVDSFSPAAAPVVGFIVFWVAVAVLSDW